MGFSQQKSNPHKSLLPKPRSRVSGIFAEILLAATYFGIGKRALEIGGRDSEETSLVSNDAPYFNDKTFAENCGSGDYARWRFTN